MIIKSKILNKETLFEPIFPAIDEKSKTPKPTKISPRFFATPHARKHYSSIEADHNDSFEEIR